MKKRRHKHKRHFWLIGAFIGLAVGFVYSVMSQHLYPVLEVFRISFAFGLLAVRAVMPSVFYDMILFAFFGLLLGFIVAKFTELKNR